MVMYQGSEKKVVGMLSRPLHNFSLPSFNWVSQIRFNTSVSHTPSKRLNDVLESEKPQSVNLKKSEIEVDGVHEIREKLLLHLRNSVDNAKDPIFKEGVEEEEFRPSNLRKKRASCTALTEDERPAKSYRNEYGLKTYLFPQKVIGVEIPVSKPLRSSRVHVAESNGIDKEKKQITSLKVALSKAEIEEDYFAMFGKKPPRRPNKLPKTVQKELDDIFPGLQLLSITADLYKVLDEFKSKKVSGR